ncbi:MAG: LCP family protein [Bacillota bacterium]|nr:LCP family protein [Bacillota bacterium]
MDERERQYQEYLALREKHHHQADDRRTYGESEMRRIYQDKAERQQREREQYMAMREHHHENERHDAPHNRARHILDDTLEEFGYEKEHDYRQRPKKKKKKRKNKGKRVARGVLLVMLLLGIFVLGGGLLVFATLNSMQDVDVDKDEIAINPEVATQLDNYENIAVLGTDARVDDTENARSDAIIVASINKETDEVKMFSVYRDTLLDVGDEGLDKITHAYSYGGAQQSLYTLNKNLDLNIDKVVVINWKTVADMIDSVGGIEIDVQDSEIEEMNKYINETARNVDGPNDKIQESGKQTLNGVQAVTYSRIRKDALTGDYRRNERMKIVFSETFKKLRESGYLEMFRVTRKVLPEVGTNIKSGELLKMMLKFKSYDMTDSTTGFPYDVGSWTGYGGAGYAWYGPPINLTNNVSKLHEKFFGQGGYTPTDTVQEISANISALTGIY